MPEDDIPAVAPMNPAIPQDGQLAPQLQDMQNQFSTDDSRSWAGDTLARLQQHVNEVNTVDANTAAGQQFENTINNVKTNLIGMVKADPTSARLGIDLAHQLVSPLLAHADDDTHDSIVGGIQQEVAHNAIMRMADLHSDTAHAMVGELVDHIGDGNEPVLRNYIDTMQAARLADADAVKDQVFSGQQQASQIAAYKFGSTLLDPRTEDIAYPAGYLQSLVRNDQINPDDKAPLFKAFSQLRANGDVHASDPYAVQAVLQGIADPRTDVTHDDIMGHVGSDLRYVDALMLHGMNLQRTPEGEANARQLATALENAQSTLASSGDRAGSIAYSRFVNWLLPAYRRTGMAGLNPDSDNYLFKNASMAAFAPTARDAVAPFNPAQRRPLAEIMGGKNGGNA